MRLASWALTELTLAVASRGRTAVALPAPASVDPGDGQAFNAPRAFGLRLTVSKREKENPA